PCNFPLRLQDMGEVIHRDHGRVDDELASQTVQEAANQGSRVLVERLVTPSGFIHSQVKRSTALKNTAVFSKRSEWVLSVMDDAVGNEQVDTLIAQRELQVSRDQAGPSGAPGHQLDRNSTQVKTDAPQTLPSHVRHHAAGAATDVDDQRRLGCFLNGSGQNGRNGV